MVVLVITRSSWNTDNNVGNTLSSLFSGMDCEFHSLYCREGAPKNNVARSYFRITEMQLLRSLFGGGFAGCLLGSGADVGVDVEHEVRLYDRAKRFGGSPAWFARELLWALGRWESPALDEFLGRVRPDVVFMPAFDAVYPYRLLRYAAERSGASAVLYHTDDNYSLRQFRVSPIYWIRRIWLRRRVRRAAQSAMLNYCITEEQAQEYSRTLGVSCQVLQKGADFDVPPDDTGCYAMGADVSAACRPLHLVYTGNVSSGRWRALLEIGRSLEDVMDDAVLDVYTLSQLSPWVVRRLSSSRCIRLREGVASEQIHEIQRSADILVHVESLRYRERLETRLSFSTKIVDYLSRGRCILAVGWSESASIAYLQRNRLALVASSGSEIRAHLDAVQRNPELLRDFGKRAWEHGRRNHKVEQIRRMLMDDFACLAGGSAVS